MSLRVRLIVITALAFMVMFTLFTFYIVRQDLAEFERAERERNELLADAIETKIEKRFYVAHTAVQIVAADNKVRELFAQRDREGLLTLLLPVYEEISDNIVQFHFHLPDATSFLRLHLPEQYGDSLEDHRPAVSEANATGKMVSGIEEGLGGLGYRVVVPLTDQEGEHLGTVEMGGSLDEHFLERLKETYGGEFFIYSAREPGLIIESTLAEDPCCCYDELIAVVLEGQTVQAVSSDHDYSIAIIPLTDFRGDTVAYVKILTDRSAVIAQVNQKQLYIIAMLAGAIILTTILITILLKIVVLNPLEQIKGFLAKVGALDFSARLPERQKDELGEIARNLNHTVDMIGTAMSDLQAAHERTLTVLNNLSEMVYVVDLKNDEILFINRAGMKLYGDVHGLICWQALQKDREGPCPHCQIEKADSREHSMNGSLTWERRNASNQRVYDYHCIFINWIDGSPAKLISAMDITDRKAAEDLVLQSREWYRTMAEDIPLLLCRFDPAFNFAYVNNAYADFFGKAKSALIGGKLWQVIPPENRDKVHHALLALSPSEPISSHEHTNVARDGSARWVEWTNRAVYDDQGLLKEYLSIGQDVTEQKYYEAQLEYLSLHDALTGLWNKGYYDLELQRLEGGREYPIAFIVADMDKLKSINDTYGHHVGDKVLIDCATILKSTVRKGDILVRIGGDEFVMIMPRTDREAGEGVLQRIENELEEYNRQSAYPPVSISFGLAISESAAQTMAETYVEADRIMYARKQTRRDKEGNGEKGI